MVRLCAAERNDPKMIRYTLKCSSGHDFESWFASAQGFEDQKARGFVACPVCGSDAVEKALMAPSVRHSRLPAPDKATARPLTTPQDGREHALAELRRQVEANSEYVGMNFVAEARRIHAGSAPERSIHGEAKPEEARKLIEDGVPVAPLPFLPKQKSN